MSDKKRLLKASVTGLLCGILTSVALLCIFAVIMTKSGLLPVPVIEFVPVGFLALGAVLGGFVATKLNRGAGVIAGALTGFGMLCALSLTAALRGMADFTVLLPCKAAATLLGGIIGGVLAAIRS